jgi:hypothetical protein
MRDLNSSISRARRTVSRSELARHTNRRAGTSLPASPYSNLVVAEPKFRPRTYENPRRENSQEKPRSCLTMRYWYVGLKNSQLFYFSLKGHLKRANYLQHFFSKHLFIISNNNTALARHVPHYNSLVLIFSKPANTVVLQFLSITLFPRHRFKSKPL